jgi:molecular chaperone DnaK
MRSAAWGIDLGTTNSCIARATPAGADVVSIDEALTVPSIVAWNGNEFLVGQRAANQAVLAPDQAVRSIKRHMGEPGYRVSLGGVELDPVEISARILEYLKTQAEIQTGDTVEEAVITVPAWFTEPQRRDTVDAGKRAGLEVTRIINEPTAAALAYDSGGGAGGAARDGERWLVYDLGGGTFDVSILSVAGGYKEVLASCGNTFLGGDDFDHRLVLHWVDLLRDRHGTDVSEDRLAMAQLRHLAEQTKIRLSADVQTEARAFIESSGRRLELAETLTRAEFTRMIEDYIESTIAKARQALEEARVAAGDLGRVLLVGGSTRIPAVQERVAREFGIEPDAYVDADLSVALGAALQSALDHGLSAAQIVVDIAPHALGVAALGEQDHATLFGALSAEPEDEPAYPRTFVPIIRKNARLPAKFVEEFRTVVDEQPGIEVVVLQGESADTRENMLIGAFHVPLDPKPAGSSVCVGFEYDRNGLVRVSVSEQGGMKILKSHLVDLSRSPESNSEISSLQWLHDAPDEAADEEAADEEAADVSDGAELERAARNGASVQGERQLTNFLVEQVERRLAGPPREAAQDIRADLATYRALLVEGRDEEIDEVEERLYAWLEVDEIETDERADDAPSEAPRERNHGA